MRPSRPLAGLLAALALAGAVAGCSDTTPGSDRLVDALVTSGIPEAQATCVVDAVDDILDADDIEALVERGASAAPRDDPAATDDEADRLRDAMAACRELAVATSTTTVTVPIEEGTTPTVRGGLPTTSEAGDDGASIDTTAPD